MIRAMIFDLDGTLVQTERLKALSYAHATVELCPYTLSEAEAVEAFKDVVGLPRREVAQALVERFDPTTLTGVVQRMVAERKQD
jgi:beta-phosphoglucomutase